MDPLGWGGIEVGSSIDATLRDREVSKMIELYFK